MLDGNKSQMIVLKELGEVLFNFEILPLSILFSNFSFLGDRYALVNENGPNMVMIYDVNGFIAGMHSVVLKKYSRFAGRSYRLV